MKVHRQFFRLTLLALVFFLGHSLAPAQEGSGTGIGTKSTLNGFYLPEDDTKGSVVRGRVFYQNTGKPLRRGWIGFQKIRELVEPKSKDETGKIMTVNRSYGNEKFVLTNDAGEFIMKGVEAGIYQPVVRVQGILNPGYEDRENPDFQQITIDGVSEIQTNIDVQRGGAISGRVSYADGDPVIGARMQILIKKDGRFSPFWGGGLGSSVTDDRGFYRFSALPANEYFIFVTEPSVQNDSGSSTAVYNIDVSNRDSELKTFYPNVGKIADAQPISIFPGQEQTEMDLTIPDRRLFKISGLVVAKNNNVPLKNMRVSFYKISENVGVSFGSSSAQTQTDAQGNWTLIDLPAGKYRVTAAPDNANVNYGNQQKAADNQPKYAPNDKEIEIVNDNLTNVLFELSIQATISGTITVENDKPLPSFIFFRAYDVEKKMNSSAYVNNRNDKNNQIQKTPNEFRIEGLSAGNFYLAASVSGGEKYFVKSITLNGKNIQSAPLEIQDGDNVKGVKVILSTSVGIVSGKVNGYKSGTRSSVVLLPSVKSATLALRSVGGEGIIKPDGNFEANVAPGVYFAIVVTAANSPKSEADLDNWFDTITKNAPKVTVKAGETVNINLDYPK